jgi:hypothetical protein
VICFRTAWIGTAFSTLAVNLLGMPLLSHSALADNQVHGRGQEIGSKPTEISSARSKTSETPTQRPMRNPVGTGNFVYEVIDTIRSRSEELCNHYGCSDDCHYGCSDDCLEETEVCLTMRDVEDNTVRLRLNTAPAADDREKVQKTRSKR